MIDAELIIARLQQAGRFKLVGGAAEVAAAMDTGQALGDGPNAYVVPLADDPATPPSPGGPQLVVSTFGVIVMVRRFGDAIGQVTMNRLQALEDPLLDCVMGWSPAPCFDPCWWRGGKLLSFQSASLWWMYEFATRVGISPNPNP